MIARDSQTRRKQEPGQREVRKMNRFELLFPMLIMAESIAAGLIYAWRGQWAHAGYWISAAVLALFVTLMKG